MKKINGTFVIISLFLSMFLCGCNEQQEATKISNVSPEAARLLITDTWENTDTIVYGQPSRIRFKSNGIATQNYGTSHEYNIEWQIIDDRLILRSRLSDDVDNIVTYNYAFLDNDNTLRLGKVGENMYTYWTRV